MADVRSLLRNERAARRISHPHATYSTTGTLVCLVCHIQLKSESLWDGHLRSAQHAMRLQRIRDGTLGRPPGAPAPELRRETPETEDDDGTTPPTVDTSLTNGSNGIQGKKRKADDREGHDGDEEGRKRSKSTALPKGFFDGGSQDEVPELPASHGTTAQQPATSVSTTKNEPAVAEAPGVDEDEWAAFEADIAAAEAPVTEDAVISAPAISAEELAAKAREEESEQKKERGEEEVEGDKEDAARKLEDEFEEMHELEEKVKRLKEKREALRVKSAIDGVQASRAEPAEVELGTEAQDEEDEDEYDEDDDWDGFRLKA